MQISVLKSWNKDVILLEVKTSDTIGNVKLKISDKLEIPTDDQVLLYEEKLLQDSHNILHYKIPEKAEPLELRKRLRGWK